MRENGFTVEERPVADMDAVKQRLGVPDAAASCHTAQVGDYLIEGHVPAADVKRLLRERPAVRGLAAPGMPMGSPGMETPGVAAERYAVVTFDRDGVTGVYARH
ncbi:hypothetical protein MAIT1_02188 [Magnetofaba australis IT-1]|uniref:Metal-binding protein n=2 Tax=Magnetofaba TaxID=1472292 RepID=A0A1Y2K236_9PROT|nr:hypothetical protein MAIT1_02188 [Magnetofaba australis IT-1]